MKAEHSNTILSEVEIPSVNCSSSRVRADCDIDFSPDKKIDIHVKTSEGYVTASTFFSPTVSSSSTTSTPASTSLPTTDVEETGDGVVYSGSVTVHTNDENSLLPSKKSPQQPLPTSQILYIKPVFKSQADVKLKSNTVFSTRSSPLASDSKDKEGKLKIKTTTASRIFYITLLPYPTKASVGGFS